MSEKVLQHSNRVVSAEGRPGALFPAGVVTQWVEFGKEAVWHQPAEIRVGVSLHADRRLCLGVGRDPSCIHSTNWLLVSRRQEGVRRNQDLAFGYILGLP